MTRKKLKGLEVQFCWYLVCLYSWNPGFNPKDALSWIRWLMPEHPALGSWRQEGLGVQRQPREGLLSKHDDLCSNPQHPPKTPGVATVVYIPITTVLQEWRQEDCYQGRLVYRE